MRVGSELSGMRLWLAARRPLGSALHLRPRVMRSLNLVQGDMLERMQPEGHGHYSPMESSL